MLINGTRLIAYHSLSQVIICNPVEHQDIQETVQNANLSLDSVSLLLFGFGILS